MTWDEIDTQRGTTAKYMNPWDVEFATPVPPIQPAKRFKGLQTSGLLDGEAELFSHTMRYSDSTMEQLSQSLLNFNSFPAGMQGARQNLFCEPRLFNPYKEITPPPCDGNTIGNLNVTKLLSTELLIGGVESRTISPDSQASVLSFATGTAENQICNAPTKAGVNSFMLFGKVIHVNRPAEIGPDKGVSTNDGDTKPNPPA